MQDDQFWALIAQSRETAIECEAQVSRLVELLQSFEPEEIVDFDRKVVLRRFESYRWDLWAVAYIINGGSDDGFEYFRGWLISQGQEFYEGVLASPERVAERAEVGEEVECEDFLYAAAYAYERKTGNELPPNGMEYPTEPQGERWSEEGEDLKNLFPELCRKYWGEE